MVEMTGTAASAMHKPTKLNRLAKSNLIITEPLRNGSTFSVQTTFPQTEGQHLPRPVSTSGAIVAFALPQPSRSNPSAA